MRPSATACSSASLTTYDLFRFAQKPDQKNPGPTSARLLPGPRFLAGARNRWDVEHRAVPVQHRDRPGEDGELHELVLAHPIQYARDELVGGAARVERHLVDPLDDRALARRARVERPPAPGGGQRDAANCPPPPLRSSVRAAPAPRP